MGQEWAERPLRHEYAHDDDWMLARGAWLAQAREEAMWRKDAMAESLALCTSSPYMRATYAAHEAAYTAIMTDNPVLRVEDLRGEL